MSELRALTAHRRRVTRTRTPVGGWSKRAADIAIAVAALVALAPAMALIALAVRADSPGPALFRQRRGGFGGEAFLIYKFRTMMATDDGATIRQATRSDARVTRLGALLRRTSLDELPQLFNVLKGEMSIVGPRPHAIAHDHHFALVEPLYRRRRRARPGITGLAQVSGNRGPTDTDDQVRERVRLDLAYVDRWSVWLDLSIIARTLALVFRDPQAF